VVSEPADSASRSRADLHAIAMVGRAEPDDGLSGVGAALQRVCRGAVDGLPVSGAIVHLVDGGGSLAVAAASDPRAREVGELPFTMGVAPCLEAFAARRPVLVPDLAEDGRWPGFAAAARERAVAAIFALPLQAGATGLGVLDLYADQPGGLDEDDLGASLALARLTAGIVIVGADGTAPADLVDDLAVVVDRRPEIYQAQGMVMVALGVELAEALLVMRAHAFSLDVPLIELARDVISGTSVPEDWGQP
jgi:hypothetical protein